jgi:hypothetical protein
MMDRSDEDSLTRLSSPTLTRSYSFDDTSQQQQLQHNLHTYLKKCLFLIQIHKVTNLSISESMDSYFQIVLKRDKLAILSKKLLKKTYISGKVQCVAISNKEKDGCDGVCYWDEVFVVPCTIEASKTLEKRYQIQLIQLNQNDKIQNSWNYSIDLVSMNTLFLSIFLSKTIRSLNYP